MSYTEDVMLDSGGRVYVTRYSGGAKGRMVQVTTQGPYAAMTPKEVRKLRKKLKRVLTDVEYGR